MPGAGRIEDARLLTGRGRFLADVLPEGCLSAVFVRAEQAPALLRAIDAGAARALPGVALVLLADDLAAAGIGPMPQDPLPRDDGGSAFCRPVPLLCGARVRHSGEPLALVVAETLSAARDAAEAVTVDLAETDERPEIAFVKDVGDEAGSAAAMAGAAHRVTRRFVAPRIHALPLEPRGCLARADGDGRLHLTASTQNPFALRKPLAALLGLAPDDVRVTADDVGGSFGLKGFLTREEALVAFAAHRLGRAVSWLATRGEALLADHQGRGVSGAVTLGFDADLRLVALRAALGLDAGAYVSRRSLGVVNNVGGLVGVYEVPVAHVRIEGTSSTRPPIAPYRGHGRPEVTLALELALDHAARVLQVDPIDLRRRNLIAAASLPRRTALGFRLDSGDFAAVLDHALALAMGGERRRRDAAARGRRFGRGVILCVEAAGGPVGKPRPDHAVVLLAPDGTAVLAPGVMSVGQGHETTLTRLAAERLGLPESAIVYAAGDTDRVPEGRGNGGSSGLAVCGPAVLAACEAVLGEARAIVARRFGVAPEAVTQDGAVLRPPGSNEALTVGEAAALAGPGGLVGRASFAPDAATFPNGAHVAEVEIDPETGSVAVTGYWAVEDVGNVLSPQLVEGQLQGGIAQGLSQVLGERVVEDAAGQVLTGSLMDYAVPRAADLPEPRLATHPVPTALNPLGAKGVGEAGTVGALAALACAVVDALARAGAPGLDLPMTPERIWSALRTPR